MPFGTKGEYEEGEREAKFIFDKIIKKAVLSVYSNCEVLLQTELTKTGAINIDIVKNIAESDIAIVDLTGHNPNVFLELGMRYVFWKKTTILLSQSSTQAPFDIANLKFIEYEPKFDGIEKAVNDIIEHLKTSYPTKATDSLAYLAYPNLKVEKNIREDTGVKYHLKWEQFWQRFNDAYSIIVKNNLDEEIDAIIGISHGGLFVADTLYRLLYHIEDDDKNNSSINQNMFISKDKNTIRKPIISLWSDRLFDEEKGESLFDNMINTSLLESLSRYLDKENNTFLLCDDITNKGNTYKDAKAFIKKKIPNCKIIFLPLYAMKTPYRSNILKDSIWSTKYNNESSKSANYNYDIINFPYAKKNTKRK